MANGIGNPYRKHGKLASADDYDTLVYEPNKDRDIQRNQEQAKRSAEAEKHPNNSTRYKEFNKEVDNVETELKNAEKLQQIRERKVALRKVRSKLNDLNKRVELQTQKIKGLVGEKEEREELSEYTRRINIMLGRIEYRLDNH